MLALSRAPALRHDLRGTCSGGVVRRAAEHQVLEEVREAGLAGLDLVARAGLDRNLDADEVRKSRRHDDDLEAVRRACVSVALNGSTSDAAPRGPAETKTAKRTASSARTIRT